VLTTGRVSLSAAYVVDGEPTDVVIKICVNGPAVLEAVDKLVIEADEWLTAYQTQAHDKETTDGYESEETDQQANG